jgi:PAS domain S-box-containing protein
VVDPRARTLRVLLVEDADDDAELVLRELRRGGFAPIACRVDTAAAMRAELDRSPWDLVISDYAMPEFDAPSALRLLQEVDTDVPFIIVSGTVGEDTAVLAMKAGASDYLAKGNLKRLVPAVERELREASARHERRRAESALRASDERARMVGRATNDLIWDWNIDTDELWLGDAVRRCWGWDVETVAMGWRIDRVHPDDQDRILTGMREAALNDRSAWWDEYRFSRADGTYAPVLDRGYLLRDDRSRAYRMIGSMMDISERRHMEETLRASEERFRTLVGSLDELVFTLDRGQRVDAVFGRGVTRTGKRAEDLIGVRASELFGGETASSVEAACRQALSGEGALVEADLGGGARQLMVSLSPLRDVAGRVTGAVGLCRDVTEQKRVQEQLVLSDRMVSIGTMAAGVAHEINNPLAAIIVNLDYVAKQIGDARSADVAAQGTAIPLRYGALVGRLAEVAEPLRDARAAIDRVRLIVRDLKVFSRQEAADETPSGVDVERVLDSSLRMAWNEIRHCARLVKSYAGVPMVLGSESRLGQVFLNLVVNAAQAVGEGHVEEHTIRVATRVEGRHAVVEVQDSGGGMPPEVMRKLFTPFFTTKPVGTGTGLGLSICHRIVTRMGGEIDVESQVGRGTTFRVRLPISDIAAPAAEPTPAPAPLDDKMPARRGHVLIVDDEPFVGKAIVRTLSRDHDVLLAMRAAEALDRLERGERFDVILCDLMMPEMTGMELYDRIVRDFPAEVERIIFMTGGAFTPGARTFLESVPNQRIEKPFDMQELVRILAERVK